MASGTCTRQANFDKCLHTLLVAAHNHNLFSSQATNDCLGNNGREGADLLNRVFTGYLGQQCKAVQFQFLCKTLIGSSLKQQKAHNVHFTSLFISFQNPNACINQAVFESY